MRALGFGVREDVSIVIHQASETHSDALLGSCTPLTNFSVLSLALWGAHDLLGRHIREQDSKSLTIQKSTLDLITSTTEPCRKVFRPLRPCCLNTAAGALSLVRIICKSDALKAIDVADMSVAINKMAVE